MSDQQATTHVMKFAAANLSATGAKLTKWKVLGGSKITRGHVLLHYVDPTQPQEVRKLKSTVVGTVVQLLVREGQEVTNGIELFRYQSCSHAEVFKDMCAECGEDLQRLKLGTGIVKASVSMIHNVPELKVSVARAEQLGKADETRLLEQRKLVLLVDLDQTIIHTTNEIVPNDLPDVHHFQLYGAASPWYHTKLRPHTKEFLERISKLFELHICTFGARMYAHTIAGLLDPAKKHFAHRILSRDECLNPTSKTGNLKSLFPCGDSLVCIIDDREDVWNFAPNLIAVKPYLYFKNTGDINSPFAHEREAQDKLAKESKDKDPAVEKNPSIKSNDNQAKEAESEKAADQESAEKGFEESKSEQDNTSDKEKISSAADEVVDDNKKITEATIANSEADGDSNQEVAVEKEPEQSKEPEKSADGPENSAEKPNKSTEKSENGTEGSKYVIEDDDDYLLYLEDTLQRIHREFYEEYDSKKQHLTDGEQIVIPDLKEIVPRVRKAVLHKVNIVFSGVVPTNMPLEKSKVFIMAKSLGANVGNDLVFDGSPLERTTHVVAAKLGTVKVNRALASKKVQIVNPNWLHCCFERWERVDERLFRLDEKSKSSGMDQEQDGLPLDTESKSSRPKGKKRPREKDDKEAEESEDEDGNPPVYDRVTGKRVRRAVDDPVAGPSGLNTPLEGKVEPHHMLDFSPLSNFTARDLIQMGKEVDDACSEGDAMSNENSSSSEEEDLEGGAPKAKRPREAESSSDDSMNCEFPRGWSKEDLESNETKRPRIPEMEEDTQDTYDNQLDLSDSDSSGREYDSMGSDADMGADLEREFLGS